MVLAFELGRRGPWGEDYDRGLVIGDLSGGDLQICSGEVLGRFRRQLGGRAVLAYDPQLSRDLVRRFPALNVSILEARATRVDPDYSPASTRRLVDPCLRREEVGMLPLALPRAPVRG